ncbi:hypothetical protein [Desulforhopalus singaporensis]|nr:hypothetical protein [Desulforhopalus singaporensis]
MSYTTLHHNVVSPNQKVGCRRESPPESDREHLVTNNWRSRQCSSGG